MSVHVTGRVAINNGAAYLQLVPLNPSPRDTKPRPSPEDIIGKVKEGAITIHESRLPVTREVLNSALVTVQKRLKLATGMHGEWTIEADEVLAQNRLPNEVLRPLQSRKRHCWHFHSQQHPWQLKILRLKERKATLILASPPIPPVSRRRLREPKSLLLRPLPLHQRQRSASALPLCPRSAMTWWTPSSPTRKSRQKMRSYGFCAMHWLWRTKSYEQSAATRKTGLTAVKKRVPA